MKNISKYIIPLAGACSFTSSFSTLRTGAQTLGVTTADFYFFTKNINASSKFAVFLAFGRACCAGSRLARARWAGGESASKIGASMSPWDLCWHLPFYKPMGFVVCRDFTLWIGAQTGAISPLWDLYLNLVMISHEHCLI